MCRDSSVGIGTGYGLGDPGIEFRWGARFFRTCPDRPWGPPSLLYSGYRIFPGGKERPGRDADPSPPSSAVGHERVELYLYYPYGPCCLYKGTLYLFLPYGPGIESRWGARFFRTCPDRPWGPPSLLYNGYRVFPGGKERPGRDTDPSPLPVPWS